jgi:HK97 family phage major capsid protein
MTTASTAPRATDIHNRASDKPWDDFSDFVAALVRAGRPNGSVDPRLTRAATGAGVESMADGGFAIPPSFAAAIESRAGEIGQIWSRVREFPVRGNSMTVAGVDETSRANGSRWGGVSVGRVGEGDTITGGKPKFHQVALKLKKLMGLMYLSEELQEDAPAAVAIGIDAFAEELVYVTENEVINGNGGSEMLGIFTSDATVVQTKKSGQAADTIVADNVTAMLSRLNPRSRRTAVWCVDPSAEQQLPLMTIGDQPVYLPQGSLRGNPNHGLLLGLPVLVGLEYFAKLGDQGDIALLDFAQYVAAAKGTKVAQSMHARFIYDEQVIKFTTRNDGAPMWKAPLTPKNGGPTISPFVTLEARS